MKQLFFFLMLALVASAQEPKDPAQAAADGHQKVQALVDGLKFQQGEISLGNNLAKITVPAEFRFLGPKDTETVLTRIWGNPPGGERPLGMLFPKDSTPLTENSWAVIIEYESDGYVKDDDAGKINYTELLAKMQKSTKAGNAERVKQGYDSVELIGWATPPRYDAAAKKLYWAKELNFEGAPEHTLNYNIRMLGRRGVLVLNVVAEMKQLSEIEAAAPSIMAMVDFQEGHRYADFNPSKDKVATYGLAGLVAGGVLAKAGFFKALLVGLLAAKKVVVVGAIALISFLKKLFTKKDDSDLRG